MKSPRNPARLSVFVLAVLVTTLSGCGGPRRPEGPPLIPVTGTVQLDGKPLAGATVTFNPLAGTKGNGGFAVTDADGKFTLTDYAERPGCPEGEYGVTFSRMTQTDGSPIPPGSSPETVKMVEQIPRVYNEFKPGAVITNAKVKAPSSTFDFVLDSKLKPPPNFFRE